MPVPTKIKKNIGTGGVADVRVLKDSLRVIFQDGDQYQVEKGDWGDRPSGLYQVTLAKGNAKIQWLQPAPKSTLLVRFNEFGGRQNGVPEPYIKRGGERKSPHGGTYWADDELSFTAKLEVVDRGANQGLEVPYSLNYAFEQYPGSQVAMINTTAKKLQRIEEFLRLSGFDISKEDIPFSVNVLPWLEKKLQVSRKIFSITLNDKGYVDTLTEIPEYLLPPELVGTKKPAKKATKKSAAKK
jgi:hypothetical protein